MKTPKPTIAVDCSDGTKRRFASINDMCRQLGISISYACRRVNDGQPCKGWLLYDYDHASSPEADEAMRRHVNVYDAKQQRRQARKQAKREGVVSVRIDNKTVILVPASKWTPDYADRYRERLTEKIAVNGWSGNDFRQLPRVKGGRR